MVHGRTRLSFGTSLGLIVARSLRDRAAVASSEKHEPAENLGDVNATFVER